MSVEVEQLITTYDDDNDNYGHVTAIVHDTETDERSTASSEFDLFTKENDAEASAIQDAIDKL